MTLVVDASVAIKWVLLEDDSAAARELVGTEPLVAPDFLMLECANVLAQGVRRSRIDPALAAAALDAVAAAGVRLVPGARHVAEAQRLAIDLGASAYDCLYLAVAAAESATLVTADDRFARAVHANPAHAGLVRVL